jgi:hypothetical protein
MTRWLRVFGTSVRAPEPAELLEFLRGFAKEASGDFHGDAQGWFQAEIAVGAERPHLYLERYLATEEGMRHELNAWAAWVETFEDHPAQGTLMQHLTSTAQVFTVRPPADEEEALSNEELWIGLCRFLARESAGVYQVDDEGFYSADGTLLLAEE